MRGRNLTFNVVNDIKYLYVADYQAGGIFKCTLSATGDINACTEITSGTIADGIEAGYIIFGTVNNIQYAYFNDTNNKDLFTCQVKADGDFDNCSSITFDVIGGMNLITIGNSPYLYANANINSSQGVLRFPLSPTNGQPLVNDLLTVLSYSANGITGMDIYKFNGVQYLYSGYPGPEGNSWTLSSDGITASNQVNFINTRPYSINFTTPIDMSPYGYVQSTGGIYKCDVNQATGVLTNCANTTAAMGVSVAFSLFTPPPLTIYYAHNGNSGYNGNLGGTDGADAKCNADPDKPATPVGATYKAVLVDGTDPEIARVACTTANCTTPSGSWVLYPDTPYINASGETLGTTNSAGIFTSALSNSIVLNGTVGSYYGIAWTGLTNGWLTATTGSPPPTCSGWTDGQINPQGTYGDTANTSPGGLGGGTFFGNGASSCRDAIRNNVLILGIYCAEQR